MTGERKDIKLQDAQKQAQEFLATPLNRFIPADVLTKQLGGHKLMDITVEQTVDGFFAGEDNLQPTGLNPATITMRDTLGVVAQTVFQDPFILASTRLAAVKKYPEEYLERVLTCDVMHAEKCRNHEPMHTYLELMSDLKALADKGTRPSPKAIRDGISVLQDMIAENKKLHVESAPRAQSADGLEEGHYGPRATLLVAALSTGASKKPDYMPDDLYKRLRALNDIRSNELREDTRLELLAEVEKLLRDKRPMQGKDYGREFSKLDNVSTTFSIQADMMQPILNHTLQLAKTLGIDMRSRNRAED